MLTHSVSKRRMPGTKKEGCCPDCYVEQGQPHKGGCDIEWCPECGRQRLTCGCITDLPDIPWTGEMPGSKRARELGFFCKWVTGSGWVTCDASDPEAIPDLNRMYKECTWDKQAQTWQRPSQQTGSSPKK